MTYKKSSHVGNLILSGLIIFCISCGEEKETNKQSIDQYNLDNSNNYKYIFKDIIKKNKEKEEKYKKGPFDE